MRDEDWLRQRPIENVPLPPMRGDDDLDENIRTFMRAYMWAIAIGGLFAIALAVVVIWALVELVLHFTG